MKQAEHQQTHRCQQQEQEQKPRLMEQLGCSQEPLHYQQAPQAQTWVVPRQPLKATQ
jgi:hypothetical protein